MPATRGRSLPPPSTPRAGDFEWPRVRSATGGSGGHPVPARGQLLYRNLRRSCPGADRRFLVLEEHYRAAASGVRALGIYSVCVLRRRSRGSGANGFSLRLVGVPRGVQSQSAVPPRAGNGTRGAVADRSHAVGVGRENAQDAVRNEVSAVQAISLAIRSHGRKT